MTKHKNKRRKHSDEEGSGASDSDDDFDPLELAALQDRMRERFARENGEDNEDAEEEAEEEENLDDAIDPEGTGDEDDAAEIGPNGQPRRKKRKLYPENKAALENKLSEFITPPAWPWIETLVVTSQTPLELPDVHDDLAREEQFYKRTLSAVEQGIVQLKQSGVPYQRPVDFFAEMVKPDHQMAKIKDALLREKKRMEGVAERKRLQEQRKYSKQVQAQKLQDKAKQKKENIAEATKMRKQASNSNTDVSERSTIPILEAARAEHAQHVVEKRAKKNAKRDAKNAKYGFGGKKQGKKRNNSETVNDAREFKMGKNRALPTGFSKNKPGQRGGGSRPGSGGGGQNRNGSSFSVKGGSKKNRPGKARRAASAK